ncbi:MAG: hypothetical protein D6693_10515 [Planctomycetota bacterium]|nr:MAG: hypothetical protein D6693_10515 [Planctomycetota bacterium]
MRAIVIQRQAGDGAVSGVIQAVDDWPEPAPPGPGEARVRVLASALNHMDIWVGMGIPGLSLEYPRISGCDACGTVDEVGPGVDEAWIGRRVVFNAAVRQPERLSPDDPPGSTLAPAYELIGEHTHGAHRERLCLPVANLQDVGERDPVDAAAFGLVGLTAYGMFTKARVHPGQAVLITGIGGGVSTALLSLCLWAGCRVAVTSRHGWKLERARELGAHHGVLDSGEDWSKAVRGWTNKRGVDVVFDSIGRAVHGSCVASLARGGRFVTCGATSGPAAETHLGRVFWNQLRLIGSTMGTNEEFAEVVSLFRAGHLSSIVDSVHSWDRAPEAWARLEGAEQFGKVVLRWD